MAREDNGRPIAHSARFRGEQRMERATNHLMFRLFVTVILVAVAFCAGFVLRSQTALMDQWGIPVSEEEAASLAQMSTPDTYDSVSARVADVEDILATYSLDKADVTEATYSMLADLMKATGDAYAAYYNPDLYNSYIKESTSRSYAGIGVTFADYNGRAYVAGVFEGSEAEAKGVQQGDFIEAIAGEDTSAWSMTEVVNALSQHEGENVSVTWMRPSSIDAQTGDEFSTTLECKVYEEANLSTELIGSVGVVKMRQVTQNAADLVRQAVEGLTAQGATSFVLDLRDNAGGYLTQAVDVAALFVPSGVLVQIQTNDGITTKSVPSGSKVATEAPVVVLVNRYTAAAAEVLAASLQDNQRAQVVGETSIGKGSVQVVRELDFGGAVRYTAAYYLSPQGQPIDGVGVVPQVEVANGSTEGEDTQMLVAVDTARSLAPAV